MNELYTKIYLIIFFSLSLLFFIIYFSVCTIKRNPFKYPEVKIIIETNNKLVKSNKKMAEEYVKETKKHYFSNKWEEIKEFERKSLEKIEKIKFKPLKKLRLKQFEESKEEKPFYFDFYLINQTYMNRIAFTFKEIEAMCE